MRRLYSSLSSGGRRVYGEGLRPGCATRCSAPPPALRARRYSSGSSGRPRKSPRQAAGRRPLGSQRPIDAFWDAGWRTETAGESRRILRKAGKPSKKAPALEAAWGRPTAAQEARRRRPLQRQGRVEQGFDLGLPAVGGIEVAAAGAGRRRCGESSAAAGTQEFAVYRHRDCLPSLLENRMTIHFLVYNRFKKKKSRILSQKALCMEKAMRKERPPGEEIACLRIKKTDGRRSSRPKAGWPCNPASGGHSLSPCSIVVGLHLKIRSGDGRRPGRFPERFLPTWMWPQLAHCQIVSPSLEKTRPSFNVGQQLAVALLVFLLDRPPQPRTDRRFYQSPLPCASLANCGIHLRPFVVLARRRRP